MSTPTALLEPTRTEGSRPATPCDISIIVLCHEDGAGVLRSLTSIAEFNAKHPSLRIELVVVTSDVRFGRLVADQVDGDVVLVQHSLLDDEGAIAKARCAANTLVVGVLTSGSSFDGNGVLAQLGDFRERSSYPALSAADEGLALGERLQRRGIVLLGTINVEPRTVIEGPNWFYAGVNNELPAYFGAFTYSQSLLSGALTSVGRYCSIAHSVLFAETEHPTNWLSTSTFPYESRHQWDPHLERTGKALGRLHLGRDFQYRDIKIGNDVWVGARSYIKGGVTLGDGCVVGAGAVVTKDVPPYAIVGGSPARLIRYRFSDKVIERLLRVRWWQYDFGDFDGVDFENVEAALDEIELRASHGTITPYTGITRPFLKMAEELNS